MKLANRTIRPQGFTIVELLIAIVVIAVLAAITVVAFNGIQDRAKASAASQALSNAVKKIKYAQAGLDSTAALDCPVFSAAVGASPASCSPTVGSTSYQYSFGQPTAADYCITATVGSKSYKLSNTTPTASAGGCAGHGQGGVEAITNLVTNPSATDNNANYNGWPGNGGGALNQGRVSSTWAVRGSAYRNTWVAQNTQYNGDAGYVTPSWGPGSLSPNTQYTARWRAVTSRSQRLQPLAGNWMISGGAMGTGAGTVNSSTPAAVYNTNTPFDQWITFTTGPSTTGLKFGTNMVAGSGATYWNVGDFLEISELTLTEGATLYKFADGSSPNWIWNGTPNNSTSTGPPT